MNPRSCVFLILGSLTAIILVSVCALCGLGGVLVTQTGGLCLPDSLVASGALFYDDFCSEKASRAKGWVFTSTENADVLWSPNRLTQVIKKNAFTYTSWAGKSFGDLAIEIEAEPTNDPRSTFAMYGIAFGIRDETVKDMYHFGVTTSNQYFLAQWAGGEVIKPYLVDLTSSSAIQPRPSKNRLGVLVEGSRISLYINGYLVKTVSDDSFKGGHIGVFTNSALTDWTSVNFTRVRVLGVEKAKAEWGTRLAGEPTPPPTGILFDDDFSSQQASTDKGWSFGSETDTDLLWSRNKYTLALKKKNLIYSSVLLADYTDFAVEVEAQPEAADPRTEYGIVFRSNAKAGSAARNYRFGVASFDKGKTYSYYLLKEIDGKTPVPWLVDVRPSPSIKPGAKNRLGVLAEGSTLSLYINGQRVKTISDDSLSSGRVGVFVHNVDTDRAQVAFSRVTIYTVAKAKAEWGVPPAPIPGVAYHEDFQSKPDAENNGWEFGSTAKRDSIWSPNTLSIVVKEKGTEFNGPLYYDTFKDGGIEIEAQPENKPDLSYGIAFGVERDSGYTFGVTTEGNYYLYRRIDGKMVEPNPVFLRPSPHIKTGASKNRLGVLVEGSTIALYINGQPVRTIAAGSAIGGAGVFVTNLKNDQARVDFNRMTIYTLEKAKREWTAPLAATPGVWLNDDFSSKSESEANGWDLRTSDAVDSVWSPNKVTITVKKKDTAYFTYPGGIFKDMAFEIEAQPESGTDFLYGITFRSNRGAEPGEHYVFGVDPKGMYILMKKVGGKYATPDPIKPTPSPYIKPGNSKNRFGVVADGSKISLYINGYLVNTITDDSIKSGSAGLYVWNMGSDRVQVAFSRMTILTVEKAKKDWGTQVVGTPTAAPYPPGVLFHDDFSSQEASAAKTWLFGPGQDVEYLWSPNQYTIVLKKPALLMVGLEVEFKDFGIEIEAQPEDKPIFYGILFRSSASTDSRYLFGVTTTGNYWLGKIIRGKFALPNPVSDTPSPFIKLGASKNRLGVLAEGSKISLYINGNLVKTISDDSLASGQVGVFVASTQSDQVRVVFSRLTVYTVEKAKTELGKR